MALNIGASGIIRPYVKYNAKSDKWFIRAEGGGDLEIARPTFLLDLANIRTGWLRFQEGQAPERLIDPALDKVAPTPGEGFKRGFVVMAFSPKFFGGAVEMASASIHVSNAIRDVYAVFEEQSGRTENRGKVPVIACTGADAMKDKYGTNYRPKLELTKWGRSPGGIPGRLGCRRERGLERQRCRRVEARARWPCAAARREACATTRLRDRLLTFRRSRIAGSAASSSIRPDPFNAPERE